MNLRFFMFLARKFLQGRLLVFQGNLLVFQGKSDVLKVLVKIFLIHSSYPGKNDSRVSCWY
jgi:hypothetical protein